MSLCVRSSHRVRLAAMIGVVRNDQSVVDLVKRARDDDQEAWDQIVERYAPLVWATCQRYRLARSDADDVGASVWLRLVERLDTIREPAALAGWLATTTRRECLRMLRNKGRELPVEEQHLQAVGTSPAADDWVLAQERLIALRAAFADLPERCRRLLEVLFADPAPPYGEVSAMLDMPVGTIGPTRQRCLSRLRGSPFLAALGDAATKDGR